MQKSNRSLVFVLPFILSFFAALIPAHGATSNIVEVSNLRAEQRVGTPFVDIYYDVTGITPEVSVDLSVIDRADPEATPITISSATGHIGANVPTGTERHIE